MLRTCIRWDMGNQAKLGGIQGDRLRGPCVNEGSNTVYITCDSTTPSACLDASPRSRSGSYWRGHRAPLRVPARSAQPALRAWRSTGTLRPACPHQLRAFGDYTERSIKTNEMRRGGRTTHRHMRHCSVGWYTSSMCCIPISRGAAATSAVASSGYISTGLSMRWGSADSDADVGSADSVAFCASATSGEGTAPGTGTDGGVREGKEVGSNFFAASETAPDMHFPKKCVAHIHLSTSPTATNIRSDDCTCFDIE
jgi:hypothetical protein